MNTRAYTRVVVLHWHYAYVPLLRATAFRGSRAQLRWSNERLRRRPRVSIARSSSPLTWLERGDEGHGWYATYGRTLESRG